MGYFNIFYYINKILRSISMIFYNVRKSILPLLAVFLLVIFIFFVFNTSSHAYNIMPLLYDGDTALSTLQFYIENRMYQATSTDITTNGYLVFDDLATDSYIVVYPSKRTGTMTITASNYDISFKSSYAEYYLYFYQVSKENTGVVKLLKSYYNNYTTAFKFSTVMGNYLCNSSTFLYSVLWTVDNADIKTQYMPPSIALFEEMEQEQSLIVLANDNYHRVAGTMSEYVVQIYTESGVYIANWVAKVNTANTVWYTYTSGPLEGQKVLCLKVPYSSFFSVLEDGTTYSIFMYCFNTTDYFIYSEEIATFTYSGGNIIFDSGSDIPGGPGSGSPDYSQNLDDINSSLGDINGSITDSSVNEDNVSDFGSLGSDFQTEDITGIDDLFKRLYNAFCTNEIESITIKLPFVGNTMEISPSTISARFPSDIKALVGVIVWGYVSLWVLKDIRESVNRIAEGNPENVGADVQKEVL